jgi:hypothetical protein
MITDLQVAGIVADALTKTGHGNTHFVDSVRRGEQNDGPFMRGALATRDAIERLLATTEVKVVQMGDHFTTDGAGTRTHEQVPLRA